MAEHGPVGAPGHVGIACEGAIGIPGRAELGPLILPRFRGDELAAEDSILVPARVPRAETFMRRRGVNLYRCPACGNEFRHDDEYEPLCTGPGATDDHPMAVMQFVTVTPPTRTW